jgi:hypothetical protein
MGHSSEEIDHQRKETKGEVKDLPRLTGAMPDEGVSLAGGFHEGAGVI